MIANDSAGREFIAHGPQPLRFLVGSAAGSQRDLLSGLIARILHGPRLGFGDADVDRLNFAQIA